MTGRQERRRRKVLDDLKERRGYCHLKEEALDRTMWRARFGRGFGPVVRQTTKCMNGHNWIFMCLYAAQQVVRSTLFDAYVFVIISASIGSYLAANVLRLRCLACCCSS